jgi:hypothetical protein
MDLATLKELKEKNKKDSTVVYTAVLKSPRLISYFRYSIFNKKL